MTPLSNADLHRVQGRLRSADRMVHALIYGPINQPESWTAQDVEGLLEDCIADMRDYGAKMHHKWVDFANARATDDHESVLSAYCDQANT